MRTLDESNLVMRSAIDLRDSHLEDGALLEIRVGDVPVARHVQLCRSAALRRRGLLGMRRMTRDQGVLLVMPEGRRSRPGLATSIHMLGMRFPLAVAWLDAEGEIVYVESARPWRPYIASPEPASLVLELHPDHLAVLKVGARVTWLRSGG